MEINSTEIAPLLKKYGIVLIVFSIASRLFTTVITSMLFRNFTNPIIGNPRPLITNSLFYMPFISGGIVLAINLIIALIMLTDMDRNRTLTWILFILALANPWAGVIFMLLWKLAEMHTGEQGTNQKKAFKNG